MRCLFLTQRNVTPWCAYYCIILHITLIWYAQDSAPCIFRPEKKSLVRSRFGLSMQCGNILTAPSIAGTCECSQQRGNGPAPEAASNQNHVHRNLQRQVRRRSFQERLVHESRLRIFLPRKYRKNIILKLTYRQIR